MRVLLALLLLLCAARPALADWVLTDPDVHNGELALLRWQGGAPPLLAVGRFMGERLFAEPDRAGPVILIGIDVGQTAGSYPVELVTLLADETVTEQTLVLDVTEKDRGVDRLNLPPDMVTPKGKKLLKRIASERKRLDKLFASDSGPLVAGRFQAPVHDKVSSPFGRKRILNGEPRAPHSGVDFRSPSGRLIRTPAKGRVVFEGELYYTGNTVVLDHGAGLYSLYAHLQQPLCKVGQTLDPGRPLGKVGSTGRSTGAHLHWTVRLHGAQIDPLTLLERFGAKTP